jgi:drug/metabolite transporter (DMT)-like permease
LALASIKACYNQNMNWFLLALLPPIFWSITNHIDKYLLNKFFNKGAIGSVMIFSASVSLLLLPIIAIIHPPVLSTFQLNYLLIAANGTLYLFATLPYFYALAKDDASLTVPLFQTIPVFTFILGYLLLGETLTVQQLIGGAIIIISSVFISLNISDIKKIHMKWDVFFLMMLSSILFTVNFVFFKFFVKETNFFTTSFWEYVGFVIFGLILLLVKSYREGFMIVLRTNKLKVLSINVSNEIINIIAKIAFNYASILVPVTLVWIINGLQPFFVFIFGVLLTVFLPHISKEDISKKALVQRFIAIAVITLGVYLIY